MEHELAGRVRSHCSYSPLPWYSLHTWNTTGRIGQGVELFGVLTTWLGEPIVGGGKACSSQTMPRADPMAEVPGPNVSHAGAPKGCLRAMGMVPRGLVSWGTLKRRV